MVALLLPPKSALRQPTCYSHQSKRNALKPTKEQLWLDYKRRKIAEDKTAWLLTWEHHGEMLWSLNSLRLILKRSLHFLSFFVSVLFFIFLGVGGGGRFRLYWSLKNRNVQSVIFILSEDSKIKAVNKWKVLSEHCMQLGLLMLFCHNTWKNTGLGAGEDPFLDFWQIG